MCKHLWTLWQYNQDSRKFFPNPSCTFFKTSFKLMELIRNHIVPRAVFSLLYLLFLSYTFTTTLTFVHALFLYCAFTCTLYQAIIYNDGANSQPHHPKEQYFHYLSIHLWILWLYTQNNRKFSPNSYCTFFKPSFTMIALIRNHIVRRAVFSLYACCRRKELSMTPSST